MVIWHNENIFLLHWDLNEIITLDFINLLVTFDFCVIIKAEVLKYIKYVLAIFTVSNKKNL